MSAGAPEPIAIAAAPRPLGRSALRAFPLAYGCWRLAESDPPRARALVETALETGIRLFDHADIYGGDGRAEEVFGKVLAEAPRLREGMVLATKCGIVPGVPYDSTAAHIARSCEGSLRRLRAGVIDLYQIHRPDLLVHPEEVAGALVALREQGKIREAGVSNYTPSQFSVLQSCLPFRLATHQPELSVLAVEPFRDGLLDQCLEERVTPLAWSPLGGGRVGLGLEEVRRQPGAERLTRVIARLDAIAAREQAPRAAVALAFLLVHPAGVIPIVGTQRPERIREAAQALKVRLTRADWYAILEASLGERLP